MIHNSRTATLPLAAAVLLGAAPADGGAQPNGTAPPIEVRTGPHWLPATALSTSRSFACVGHAISFELSYRTTAAGRRLEMQRLTVDGRTVAREWLGEVNALLDSFASPPEVTPECGRGGIRIALAATNGEVVLRTGRVPSEQAR
jgi:hypothetical protein